MRTSTVIFALLAVTFVSAATLIDQNVIDSFKQWKEQNGKVYTDSDEAQYRFQIWKKNYDSITRFNAENDGIKLALNKFADLKPEEIERFHGHKATAQTISKTIINAFNQWKTQYNKTYEDADVAQYRFQIWRKNYETVQKNNAKKTGVTLALNKFSDLKPEEIERPHVAAAELQAWTVVGDTTQVINFKLWASKFGKVYLDSNYEQAAFQKWRFNYEATELFNSQMSGFTLALGPNADLSKDEIYRPGFDYAERAQTVGASTIDAFLAYKTSKNIEYKNADEAQYGFQTWRKSNPTA